MKRKYSDFIGMAIIILILVPMVNVTAVIDHQQIPQDGSASSNKKEKDYEIRVRPPLFDPIEMRYSYLFSTPAINEVTVNGTVYHQVSMDGLPTDTSIDAPILPVKPTTILLPSGGTVDSIHASCSDKISLGYGFNVELGSDPGFLDSTDRSDEFDFFDPTIPYPPEIAKEVVTSDFRGYNLFTFNLYPVQYMGATGELYYYQSIDVTVTVATMVDVVSKLGTDNNHFSLFRGLPEDELMMQQKTDDHTMVYTYTQERGTPRSEISSIVNPADSYKYVVITTQDLKDSNGEFTLQDLVDYKNSHGTPATIVTVEEIESCAEYQWNGWYGDWLPFFNDKQCHIRNFIKDAYLNWETNYILLAADEPMIPCRSLYCLVFDPLPVEDYIPSDLYYACLQGNFNIDRDGRWGEVTDLVDIVAEVYVGRTCVDNSTDVSNFVKKTIAYAETNDDYLRNVVAAGEHLWGPSLLIPRDTWGDDSIAEMIDGSTANDYSTVGIPSDVYTIQTLYDHEWMEHGWPEPDEGDYGWPKTLLISYLNAGIHIVNHLGHGNEYQAMKEMSFADIQLLTNNKYFFIYSQACLAGHFDGLDCFAEQMTVKTDHGAFAVIMNTRYGLGQRGGTDGPSQRFARQFFDAIYGESTINPIYREIGVANQDSKEDNRFLFLNGEIRWCYYEITLFGDPQLSLKTPSENNPPYSPGNPFPPDQSLGIPISADLSWAGGDPDSDDTVTYDVYFEADDSTPDVLVSNDQSNSSYDPGILIYHMHYYWKITAIDSHGRTTEGPIWEFTTEGLNHPPYAPSYPNPANHATGVSVNVNLQWMGGDPDPGDTVLYDVYLEAGDSTPDVLVSGDQVDAIFDPGTLSYLTHYYWKVTATDDYGATTSGPIWDFTTQEEPNWPPYYPSNPSPYDYAISQSIKVDLSWSGGDPDPEDTVTYDVYFEAEDSSPDLLVSNDQLANSFDPGTLSYNTHYYWYIVASDGHNPPVFSDTWVFTTIIQEGWLSPAGYYDPNNAWDNEQNTYDGNTDTKATCRITDSGWVWTPWIELTLSSSVECNKIRFWAWYDVVHCKKIEIHVGSASYEGTYNNYQWTEFSFSQQSVSIAYIRFYVQRYGYPYYYVVADLHEFQFYKMP